MTCECKKKEYKEYNDIFNILLRALFLKFECQQNGIVCTNNILKIPERKIFEALLCSAPRYTFDDLMSVLRIVLNFITYKEIDMKNANWDKCFLEFEESFNSYKEKNVFQFKKNEDK